MNKRKEIMCLCGVFFLMFSKRKNAFELFIDDEKQIQNKTKQTNKEEILLDINKNMK